MPSNLKYLPRVSGYWTKAPQSLSMEAKSVVVWSPITWWANTGVPAWKNTGNTKHTSGYWTWSILKPGWLQHSSFWVPRMKFMSKVSWPSHSCDRSYRQLVPDTACLTKQLVPDTAATYLQQQHARGKRRSKQMRRFTEKGINTIKLFFNVSKNATSIGSWKIKLLNVTAGARSIAAFRREM